MEGNSRLERHRNQLHRMINKTVGVDRLQKEGVREDEMAENQASGNVCIYGVEKQKETLKGAPKRWSEMLERGRCHGSQGKARSISRLASKQFSSLLWPPTCPTRSTRLAAWVCCRLEWPVRLVHPIVPSFTHSLSFKVPTMCKGLCGPSTTKEQM